MEESTVEMERKREFPDDGVKARLPLAELGHLASGPDGVVAKVETNVTLDGGGEAPLAERLLTHIGMRAGPGRGRRSSRYLVEEVEKTLGVLDHPTAALPYR